MMVQDEVQRAERTIQLFSYSPSFPRCFQLGSVSKRLTLHAQQVRAFNLAWALLATKRLRSGSSVGIVGGGLAGMTVAAALAASGVRTTVYERNSDVLHLQRGNRLRFLHPNINDWPNSIWEQDSTTDLPFLSWTAGYSDEVAMQIIEQWKMISPRINLLPYHEVTGIHDIPERFMVGLTTTGSIENYGDYHCVILCVGYGYEKRFDQLPLRSYWENDHLAQPVLVKQKKRFLVMGCGDGGLTDALRLTLSDFDHGAFLFDIAMSYSTHELRSSLQMIDTIAQESVAKFRSQGFTREQCEDRIRLYLHSEYQLLKLPDVLMEVIKQQRRTDTEVIINNRGPTPFSLEAALINRFSVLCLMRIGAITYVPGTPELLNAKNDAYTVMFKRHGYAPSSAHTFDEIVVRYGVNPVIDKLIPEADLEKLREEHTEEIDEFTRSRQYPPSFLKSEFDQIRTSYETVEHVYNYHVGFRIYDKATKRATALSKSQKFIADFARLIGATISDEKMFADGLDDGATKIDDLTTGFSCEVHRGVEFARCSVLSDKTDNKRNRYTSFLRIRTRSKSLLDSILDLQLQPYIMYMMEVRASQIRAVGHQVGVVLGDVHLNASLTGAFAPRIEITRYLGMYQAHRHATASRCFEILTSKYEDLQKFHDTITNRLID